MVIVKNPFTIFPDLNLNFQILSGSIKNFKLMRGGADGMESSQTIFILFRHFYI